MSIWLIGSLADRCGRGIVGEKVGSRPPGDCVRYSALPTKHVFSRLSPTQSPGGRLPTNLSPTFSTAYQFAAYLL
ncbi:MAG: hypothetical protein FWG73_05615 [Planctomycetaceae bacterium]|nr:hypothetical protein [Planctomycetaceae bacterium]